jgi:hypothetical protein
MKDKVNTALFLVRLNPEERKLIKLKSIELNTSMSDVIRFLINNNTTLDKQKQENQFRLKAELKDIERVLSEYFAIYKLSYNNNANNITEDFKTQFLEKFLHEFPSVVQDEKRFELSGVNFNLLNSLENKRTNTIDEIEFNNPIIKLTTSQANSIKAIEKIIKLVDELNESQTIDYKVQFIRDIAKSIVLQDGKLAVNTYFILNKELLARC